MFSALQNDEDHELMQWVVRTCSPRILYRLKILMEVNKATLSSFISYTLTPEDAELFKKLFPDDIVLSLELHEFGDFVASSRRYSMKELLWGMSRIGCLCLAVYLFFYPL